MVCTRVAQRRLAAGILLAVVNGLCAAEGRQPLKAGQGYRGPWWMRQTRKSPRFTTSWEEIPLVKAS